MNVMRLSVDVFARLVAAGFALVLLASSPAAARPAEVERHGTLDGVRLPFVENQGRVDPRVAYYAPTFAGIAVHANGTRVYVTNLTDSSVTVIDAVSNAVVTTIPVGNRPFGVAVHPAGTRAYVANFDSNTVSVIDTTTDTVVTTVPVAVSPGRMALTGVHFFVPNAADTRAASSVR